MARSQAGGHAVVAILFATLASASADARQEDVRIHGRVVTENGGPVRGASVVLATPVKTWTVSTDDSGVFDARGLHPGNYEVRVSKAGLLVSLGGGTRGSLSTGVGPGLSVQLGAVKSGESRDVGTITMRRAGAIAGRVVDVFGEPVMGAIVSVSRVTYLAPGDKLLMAAKTVTTNDLGAYRAFGLEPGIYFVSASRNVSMSAVVQPSGTSFRTAREEAAPTFYPSARFDSDAEPVRVTVGEDRLGIDVALIDVPLARVGGRVTNSDGQPAVDALVSLSPQRGSHGYAQTRTDAQGMFSLGQVPQGEYQMFAGSREFLALAGQQGTANVTGSFESGSMPLKLAGDTTGIEFRLSPGFDIRGRLLIDGNLPAISPDQRLMITAAGPGSSRAALVQPSGDFVMRGSAGGRVRLSALGLPQGGIIARVSLNGIDVTDEGFEVSGPIVGVEVMVTTRPSVVSGIVTSSTGQRMPSSVIVFSDDSRLWTLPNTRYVKNATASANGGFSIRGLPAGSYLAVAVWLDPNTWPDPLNLQELRKVATPFTVPESGTVTVNLVRR